MSFCFSGSSSGRSGRRVITLFKTSTAIALFLTALLAGRAASPPAQTPYAAPSSPVMLADKRVNESSGIVASRRTPGVLWTHNDSGDGPYLYATDAKGRALARVTVTGATNVDWEDIAAGPGNGDNAQIYVGDIGDNSRSRTDCAVYRVYEPAVDIAKSGAEGRTMLAEKFPYRYPDGPHDAETLLVHPITSEVFIVTKEASGASGVFRFPELRRNLTTTLEKVASVQFGGLALQGRLGRLEQYTRMATGGDISPDGRRVIIRTYTEGCEWYIRPGEPLAQALAGKPSTFLLPFGQGESVCYSLDGRALYLTAEGSPCPLWTMRAAAAPSATGVRRNRP